MANRNPNRTLPILNFDYAADKTKYFKAFCVNPASDHCDLGVCPNTDVTGIGQQISIYITTFVYAMVLAYIPWLHRPMLYAHLSILYSLYIAALVSMLQGELSYADGIFVLVTAGSPSSVYLWYLTIRSFWNAKVFPLQHADKSIPPEKSREVKLTRWLSLGSLVFEVVLIILMFAPKTGIKFSQPGCNLEYGRALWYNVAWQLPVVIQTAAMFFLFFVAFGVTRLWTLRWAYQVPPVMLQPMYKYLDDKPSTDPRKEIGIDLITWTEQVLFDQYPNFMNRTLFICLVSISQLASLPDLALVVSGKDCFALVLVAFGLFREKPKPESDFKKVYLLRILITMFFVVVWIIRFFVGIFPSGADWVMFFIGWTAAAWSRSRFSRANMRVFLPILLLLFSCIIVVANIFIVTVGDPKSFKQAGFHAPDGAGEYSYFTLDIMTIGLWIICWMATSNWPWGKSLSWDKLNKAIWRRAHMLKFCWIVLGPHILWIQASNNSNPSRALDMTFGQIFALIVSAVTIFTLADEARDVKKETWVAWFKSDIMPSDDMERPKHYVSEPGLCLS